MKSARIWKRAAAAGILAATVAVLNGAPASAAQAAVAAGPYAAATGFATPQVIVFEGDSLSFVNTDVSAHRIEAKDFTQAGPLFASALIGVGGRTVVEGVEDLAPGAYGFVCTLHPSMTGTITVLAR